MIKSKKLITYLLLGLIFLVAVFLRFYKLGDFPVGFHIDEANLGYNAYSLLLTGKDDSGTFLPIYTSMFNDNNPTGYHYLTILPIKIFGLTEFATRFPGAFFASMTIIVFFFLSKVLFKDIKTSLLAAFLIGIAPWNIVFGRGSAETIVALFFIILGFTLILKSIGNGKSWAIFGVLILSLSFFIYPMSRIFVPSMFLGILALFFFYKKSIKIDNWKTLFGCFVFLVIVDALLIFLVNGGTGRFNQVNIFNSFETGFEHQQQTIEDAKAGENPLISRLLHNKITNIIYIFTNNYLEYFSPTFLFTKGGLPIWFQIPRMGLLYIVELPLILFGVYKMLKSKEVFPKILILWLVLAPITAAITFDDSPNIRRSMVLFPALELFAAYGFIQLLQQKSKINRRFIISFGTMLLVFNMAYFLQQYFVNAKIHKPWYRNNGFSQMMQEVNKNYDNYDAIVISKYQGGIYPLVLFYSKYDPAIYQKEGSPKDKDYSGFGKFFFVPQDCPSVQRASNLPKVARMLFVDKGDCPDDSSIQSKKIKYIDREDGTKAFRMVYEN